MVSSNLGLTPIDYQYIDEEPINFRKLKKTVPIGDGNWEERVFYEIKPMKRETIDWLTTHYGRLSYQNTWWSTHTSVVMNDKIYTHWKLCE